MSRGMRREAGRARVEDLQWMADTGESLEGAAVRIGLSRESLAKWMDTNGLRALKNHMSARDYHPTGEQIQPKNANRYANHPRRTAA